jgi:hypothetical protein
MKVFLNRGKFKQRERHNYWLRKHYVLARHWWDCLRFCPTIFEVDISDQDNPCRDQKYAAMFAAYHIHINERDWWHWLLATDLPGKVKVDFYFSGWYSTFLHDDPAEQQVERGTLRIAFSNKAAAMMFKLNFACPQLETIQVAHS